MPSLSRRLSPISNHDMKIGIYSAEDPTSRATWSGTPTNLIDAFRSLGVPMAFFSPAENSKKPFPARLLNTISQASAIYSEIGSTHFSRSLIEYFEARDCDVVLHAPADHLPASRSMVKALHVAFLDATFKQFFFPWFKERYRKRSPLIRSILQFEMARRNRFYRSSLGSIAHFFVTSSWTRESLVSDYGISPERITVCYTGTGNISALNSDRTNIPPRLLFVARHNYIAKGAKLLLSAFRLIREKHPEAELTIVGPSAADLGATADEAQVSIHGFLPWEELELLFNQSTLFVMPSEYEPYGLVYLEAMKCGMPVICSSSGGMASIVSEQRAGWIVENLEPQTLSRQLDECLLDLTECHARGENGRSFVAAKCSWTTCAQTIKDQLDLLLRNHPVKRSK